MGEFGKALLIVGSENLLVERAIGEQVEAARSLRPGAELVDLTAAEVADGRFAVVIGGSLFAASSIVVMRDISGVPADQADLVVRTAARPSDDLCLVMTHPGGVKGKALLDRLAQAHVPKVSVEAVKAGDLPGFVMAEGRRAKVRLDLKAATALVDAVGADLNELSGAVRQLASDWPGQQLDAALINRYFAGRAEVSGFAISDAVMAGRPQEALGLLRWALATGTPPVLITSALAGALRAVGRYFGVRTQRLGPPDMARVVGVPPWKVKDIAAQSRQWAPEAVARGIDAVARADAQVKGAGTDPGYALEQLVLTLDRARRGV